MGNSEELSMGKYKFKTTTYPSTTLAKSELAIPFDPGIATSKGRGNTAKARRKCDSSEEEFEERFCQTQR